MSFPTWIGIQMSHTYYPGWNPHTVWSHSLEILIFWNRTNCKLWSRKIHRQVLWFWKPSQHRLLTNIERCLKSHGWIEPLLLLLWCWSNSWTKSGRKPFHGAIGIHNTSIHKSWWTSVPKNFEYEYQVAIGNTVWGKECQDLKGSWQICWCIWNWMVQTNTMKSNLGLSKCNSLLN